MRCLTPFRRPSDFRIGQEITEGGKRRKIFEADFCYKKHRRFNYVLKIFKVTARSKVSMARGSASRESLHKEPFGMT